MSAKPVVLIVEDYPLFEKMFKEQLEDKVEVLWASNGEAAVKMFVSRREDIRLISSDGMVGPRDMVEFVELMRNPYKGNFQGPILAASSSEEHSERMVAAGATRVVSKDRVPEEILKELGIDGRAV